MIEFIAFSIFILLFFISLVFLLKISIDKNTLRREVLKLNIEKSIITEKLLESLALAESQNIEKTDDFLKFISDSRDWAFEYIETVQEGLNRFIKDAGPVIDHFNEYGEVIWTPLTDSMRTVSLAYEDLKKLLPDEYGKLE